MAGGIGKRLEESTAGDHACLQLVGAAESSQMAVLSSILKRMGRIWAVKLVCCSDIAASCLMTIIKGC